MADYLKIPEVARRLDVSEKTVRRYIKGGTLPSTFIGGAYRVTEEDLEEYIRGAEVKPEDASPKAEGRSSLEISFDDLLVEERLIRYLQPVKIFASIMAKEWASKVERADFSEAEFARGVDTLLALDTAFVKGIGTDLLAALRRDDATLPQAERDALNSAKAAIDGWHRTMWTASDILDARGDNVSTLAEVREARDRLARAG